MNRRIQVLLFALFIISLAADAQEQVRKEFHHKNIFENKYVRILDVNIKPGDKMYRDEKDMVKVW